MRYPELIALPLTEQEQSEVIRMMVSRPYQMLIRSIQSQRDILMAQAAQFAIEGKMEEPAMEASHAKLQEAMRLHTCLDVLEVMISSKNLRKPAMLKQHEPAKEE